MFAHNKQKGYKTKRCQLKDQRNETDWWERLCTDRTKIVRQLRKLQGGKQQSSGGDAVSNANEGAEDNKLHISSSARPTTAQEAVGADWRLWQAYHT